jgi:hypothetical protein
MIDFFANYWPWVIVVLILITALWLWLKSIYPPVCKHRNQRAAFPKRKDIDKLTDTYKDEVTKWLNGKH